MSRALDPVVPAALRAALAPEPAASDGVAILVVTTRADGWPHVAMVSAGELVVIDDSRLALALWPDSTTAANARERPRLTLTTVIAGASYSLRSTARRLADLETPRAGRLAQFGLTVDAASADAAPYAVLETGVRFRLTDPTATLLRWREVRAALRGDKAVGA
jgi:hypothetical protein